MNQLLIATKNKGKIREMKALLADLPYEIKTVDDMGMNIEIEETGKSYAENALLKAKKIGESAGFLTLGEDSGLEIDAFDGWPGIYSARHAIGSDENKIDVILKRMMSIPKEKRTARYKSVVAIYDPKSKQNKVFTGSCEGFITEKRIGTQGFGYDPIFWSTDLNKTFADAAEKEKNKVSHRSQALGKCKQYLSQLQ